MKPVMQIDLQKLYAAHEEECNAAVLRVLRSGWYILGNEVKNFERMFAAFCRAGHAVGVANGTDAVELALRGVGVTSGDKVATVSLTAVATVAAIERIGAHPVLVDVEPLRFTMCSRSLETALKAYGPVKAVVPVHLYGQCADMPSIISLAEAHGAVVIEDCAQAHGAALHGMPAGSLAAVAAFSFYPTKNLGAFGDGGAVVTSDADIAQRIRVLRQYGWTQRYESDIPGVNSRLDELQAALLSVRLPYINTENERRRHIALRYNAALEKLKGITAPQEMPDCTHIYHQYVVQCPQRDLLLSFMKEHHIHTAVHYPIPIHRQKAYEHRILMSPEGLPVTERLCREILSLPMHAALEDSEVERVCDVLQHFSLSQ